MCPLATLRPPGMPPTRPTHSHSFSIVPHHPPNPRPRPTPQQPLAGSPKALLRGNKYEAGGLRRGAAAAHILVFDRATKRVVEEAVSPALTLAMRAMYQSAAGKLLMREGAYSKLRRMTGEQ